MKAKIVRFEDQVEVQLANGLIYGMTPEMTDENELFDAVEELVQEEMLDTVEFTETSFKKVSAYSTKQLLNALKKSKSLYTKMIASILDARDVEYTIPVGALEEDDEEEIETELDPIQDSQNSDSKGSKSESKVKPKKNDKDVSEEPKQRKLMMTLEEAIEALAKAKKMKGEQIMFKPTGFDEPIQAIIKGAGMDKRSNRVYYAVAYEVEGVAKVSHPSIDNKTIQFEEL